MKMQLVSKTKEARDVTSFVFKPDQKIEWLPGQFLHYSLPHENPDDRGMERWFTISAAPFEGHIQVTTRQAAKSSSFKRALFNLGVGSYIDADTPEGDFLVDQSSNRHVFIAGGIGITPYRSMLAQANHENKMPDIHLLYKNHDEEFVFDKELSDIASKQPNLRIVKYVDPKIITHSDLKQFVNQDTAFYLSGPTGLVKDYKEELLGLGVSINRLKTDFFPGYQVKK